MARHDLSTRTPARTIGWRWVSGAPLDGVRRTDATWFHPATTIIDPFGTVVPVSGRAYRWQQRPRWQRAAHRTGGTLAVLGEAYGQIVDPTLTTSLTGVAAAGGLAYVGNRAHRRWALRQHRHKLVQPLMKSLSGPLNLPVGASPDKWLLVPKHPEREGSITRVNLPDHWVGEEYQQLAVARLIDRWVKVPMEVSRVHLTSAPRFMEFMPTPQPPDAVAWESSDSPYVMHIGAGAGKTPIYARTETDVPHMAVVAGSGSGKTTTLTVPLLHNREHGALVDIIDLKRMSFTEIDDEHPHGIAGDPSRPSRTVSGVRIHTRIEDSIRALAEFVASATAIALMQQAGMSTKHLPARVLIIDEFGSFAGGASQWWTGPGKQKKQSPIPFWLHVTLMQGRALEHRIVLGAHQMSLTLFGKSGSDARDLFSGRILTGTCSAQKWITTYGHVKKPAWDADIKGRGTYGPLGERPELIQIAYIPQEEANARLRELPEAPEWFDAGSCAPWITEEHVREVESSYGAGRWVPGWGHLFDEEADDDMDETGSTPAEALVDSSSHDAGGWVPDVTVGGWTPDVTDYVTVTHADSTGDPSTGDARDTPDPVTVQPVTADTDGDGAAERITLPEACRTGVIPLKPGTARAARMRDPKFPKGQGEGRDQTYTPEELQAWYANRIAQ
ncbi:hypothetical protein ACG83_41390 [Frankia sp. R43]|uniref:type IV secretory system conjugative DNA transfer family protein n=1 Tax=Frankia sp. R43 TaxID=269536 RepID=UPI0006CA28BB|nr:type IV secretory system conjugative DNA transfer family protein [Frankia sp. R43]KPM50234.1 hypothetical protein ACG83_41390 [Frankia sp. R43]